MEIKNKKVEKLIYLGLFLLLLGLIVGFCLGKVISGQEEIRNFHYLTITKKSYYDDFFFGAGNCQNNFNPATKGLIVNHHLLAGDLIAQGLCSVATNKKITVILLSPNHFDHGNGIAISSLSPWETPYGQLDINKGLIEKFVKTGAVIAEEKPFEEEHGVYNIIPFVKKVLPNAQVVPIIIKDRLTQEEKDKLNKSLVDNIPSDSIVIASLDFSHYLTSDEANIKDKETLLVLSRVDSRGVGELNIRKQPDNVDSKILLEIFLALMAKVEAKNFKLINHSNSAKLVGDTGLKETTSYIVGSFNMLK